MTKYILTGFDEYLRLFDKKPTSEEIDDILSSYGYGTEEVQLYEVAKELTIQRKYTITDKKGSEVQYV